MKKLDLVIDVDTQDGTIAVNKLSDSVDKLADNTLQASKNAEKSSGSFRKLGDGIKALSGATFVLKAFDVAVETFKSLDVVSRAVEKSLAAIKAAFFTLAPIVENFGKATLALVTGEFEESGKFAGIMISQLKKSVDTFKELNDQAQNTVDLFRELRDAERELNVATAERQAIIEKNKFISDDETKSIEERIKAAKTAFDLETQIANERIKLEERRLALIKADPTRDPKAEATLNEIAAARIAIFQAQNDQISRQTELNNKINQLEKERFAINDEYRAQELGLVQTQEDVKREIVVRANKLTLDELDKQNKNHLKQKYQDERASEAAKLRLAASTAGSIFQLGQAINDASSKNAEKQFKRNKALSLSEVALNTGVGVTVALRDPTTVDPITKALYVASIIATGAAQAVKISSTKYQENSTTTPSFELPNLAPIEQPATNSGLANQINQQPVQAYITATDVSNALEARKMLQNKNTL